jgi:hypothetical protein
MGKGRKKMHLDPTRNWGHKDRKNKGTAADRLAWVEEQWLADPTIPLNGRHGMQQRLLEVFGVAARDEQLLAIRQATRDQLRAEGKLDGKGRVVKPEPQDKKPLTQKLQLPALPEPKPVPKPEPEPEPEKKMHHDKPLRIVAADKPPQPGTKRVPVVSGPGTTKSTEDTRIRASWAADYLRRNPNARNADVIAATKAHFGMGLCSRAIGDIRRQLGVGIIKRRVGESHRHIRDPLGVVEVPTESVTPKETSMPRAKRQTQSPQDVIKAALVMLLEEVPGLRSLTVTIDDDGKPHVDYKVETVVSGKVDW